MEDKSKYVNGVYTGIIYKYRLFVKVPLSRRKCDLGKFTVRYCDVITKHDAKSYFNSNKEVIAKMLNISNINDISLARYEVLAETNKLTK